MRLGYAAINTELRTQGIFTSRTCRAATIESKGIELPIDLARHNLSDLTKILRWNEDHNIFLYRMSSQILPHISDSPRLKVLSDGKVVQGMPGDRYKLLYEPKMFSDAIREIKAYSNHRLTFHPDPYIVLSSPSRDVVMKSVLELNWHAKFLDLISDNLNNIIVLHGGGTYDNKDAAKARWIKRYLNLPSYIQQRIVLENDETRFSLDDILDIHFALRQHDKCLPLVLDWFHFKCYTGKQYRGQHLQSILDSWTSCDIRQCKYTPRPKMHISNQLAGARFGAHDNYVSKRSFYHMLRILDDAGCRDDIDVMIEAKMKEQAVLGLMESL